MKIPITSYEGLLMGTSSAVLEGGEGEEDQWVSSGKRIGGLGTQYLT